MGNIPRTLKKGGYAGDQRQIVRFRASAELHKRIQELARRQELCIAALVRRLVVIGLEKSN